MRSRNGRRLAVAAVFCAATAAAARAHTQDLPAGPIHDRHALMEAIGKNAKLIGDAMKSGNFAPVGAAAEEIRADSAKVLPLFPAGSLHPKSRAKPEIWKDWAKFEAGVKEMQDSAAALATAAKAAGNVPEAAQKLFGACKSCHQSFREPDKQK